MLPCRNGIGLVVPGSRIPPNMMPGIHTKYCNHCFIRLENFVSCGLRILLVQSLITKSLIYEIKAGWIWRFNRQCRERQCLQCQRQRSLELKGKQALLFIWQYSVLKQLQISDKVHRSIVSISVDRCSRFLVKRATGAWRFSCTSSPDPAE